MSTPLGHLRVVEMATAIQGPAAGMYLSDMGAEVIKVEPPWGEMNRYFRGANNTLPPEVLGSQFVAMNRGKRSVCLDIHTELGLRAVQRLVAGADVFLSNYREKALVKMGLGYDEVKSLNPGIIYGHVNGFGPRGPDADKTMLDGAAIARGGLASVTGSVETGPIAPGATIADTAGAMQLALAIMTALVTRTRDGCGQKVQTSALGAQLWLQQWELTHVWMTGTMLKLSGAHHGAINGPYGIYETADSEHFLFALAQSDESWDQFWLFVDDPQQAINPKWDTPGKRLGNFASQQDAAEIQQRMREAFKTKTTKQWQTFLATQSGIVYEKVQNYDEVRTDPQLLANEYLQQLHLQHVGETTIVGNLISFSETPASVEGILPALGVDTETVLRDLGFSSDETESVIQHATAEREDLLGNS
jgi:crotonobetainyl-CoA:carnitine CoA-transferase CaiB-like acyl-CoA transferase